MTGDTREIQNAALLATGDVNLAHLDHSAILGIDPGLWESGWATVTRDGGLRLLAHGVDSNPSVRMKVQAFVASRPQAPVAIEHMQPRGQPTSKDEMDTLFAAGRMTADVPRGLLFGLTAGTVRLHMCGMRGAKDANVRQAVIDRWGGDQRAIGRVRCGVCRGRGDFPVPGTRGRKACPNERLACQACRTSPGWYAPPGPLANVRSHAFQAIAVAVTILDMLEDEATGGKGV